MMEGEDENLEEAEDMDEEVMEAITLKKVSVTHGDNGVQTKSPSLVNSGQAGMDSKPVKFSGASEAVPTGPTTMDAMLEKVPERALIRGMIPVMEP